MKLKMFAIPNPEDYHKQGEYVVLAKDKKEAVAILKNELKDDTYSSKPKFKKTKEDKGNVYKNIGCDC